MEINLAKAVKQFFPNPSLEMVYFEAVANSIDANAKTIEISIDIKSYNDPESLFVKITDDGVGFTEKNFKNFSKLLETDREDHKGLGRLVFLNYFKTVNIESAFDNKKRTFIFNESFSGDSKIFKSDTDLKNTSLYFSNYVKKTVKTYDYIKPSSIKRSLILHFFPQFHSLKIQNSDLKIIISVTTEEENSDNNFFNDTQLLSIKDLPDLQQIKFHYKKLDLFEEFELYYSIDQNFKDTSQITAICAAGRTIPVDIISKESIPQGYEIVFLLYSKLFDSKVNASRQKLDVDDSVFREIKNIFSEKIGEILIREIPSIEEHNQTTKKSLDEKFPHLQGYFSENTVGLLDKNKSLENAQKKFFQAQKETLEAIDLTDKQFENSLDISARLLTEYILYRNIIINQIKKIDITSKESEIHKLIIPMRTTFKQSNVINDIFTNNIWLLDDKYMSYSTILSDEELDKLLLELKLNEDDTEKDSSRPDISIVFSNDPSKQKVDVVIVELKKLGLNLAKREEVESQLRQRARKLLKYYPNKIQRIWFYGIVDVNSEFRISLKEQGYTELYSSGTVLYNEQKIILDEKNDIRVPIGFYILSPDAFLNDAENRNKTFLNILKAGIKDKVSYHYQIEALKKEIIS